MAELPTLTKTEWHAMMAAVLSDVSIDPTDKWSSIDSPGNQDGKHLSEIPDNHPADGGPVLQDEPQRNDNDDDSNITDEIPAGGGFKTVVGKPEPKDSKFSTGVPSGTSEATKPDAAPVSKFSVKVGKPEPTGKPSGSFASSDGTGPDASTRRTDSNDRAPRSHQDDGGSTDKLSLPDGTFFTQSTDDLKNNVQKVQNADQNNPHDASHPWYVDVKRHLMNRAADLQATHLIPADWNLSMGMRAEAELGRDIDTATREAYAKKGWALPNKSYPIGNATDLRDAIDLARSGHGNVTAAKALIRKRAKDLGEKVPPDFK